MSISAIRGRSANLPASGIGPGNRFWSGRGETVIVLVMEGTTVVAPVVANVVLVIVVVLKGEMSIFLNES